MGESLFSWITLLTISMVSAEQGPSVSATLFLCCMCQGRTFESAPPDHNTLVACSHLQNASKNGAQYGKKMPRGSRRLRSTFCEVSCLRRLGLREYLLSNGLLVSELKLKSKSCSAVPAFLDFLQQKFRGAALRIFASVSSLSAVSLAADPYSAPSLLPSALKAPFWLLPLPSEGGYLAAQMQMKLLDLVEGIRWH